MTERSNRYFQANQTGDLASSGKTLRISCCRRCQSLHWPVLEVPMSSAASVQGRIVVRMDSHGFESSRGTCRDLPVSPSTPTRRCQCQKVVLHERRKVDVPHLWTVFVILGGAHVRSSEDCHIRSRRVHKNVLSLRPILSPHTSSYSLDRMVTKSKAMAHAT
jgi:hypothetical protein